MRIEGERESDNVEDRRGQRAWQGPSAGIGCGGLLLVLLVALITGKDPSQLLQLLQTPSGVEETTPAGGTRPPADALGKLASVVLASTEDTWAEIFAASGRQYAKPKMVLFSRAVQSACGFTSSAVGPFYCPADGKLYLDLSFFHELEARFAAPGDFAQAYVIAHEVGHHVQNLLGISERVEAAQRSSGEVEANAVSVRLELQADCLAGVWANHANRRRKLLEPGDVEEGLNAAAAIGDDRLQRLSTGHVQPESFTHGSSAQRVRWLKKGLQTGDPNACKTPS